MRFVVFIFGFAVTYALLRGWPTELPLLSRVALATIIFPFTLLIWVSGPFNPSSWLPRSWSGFLMALGTGLLMELAFFLHFSDSPEFNEKWALQLDEYLHPEEAPPENTTGTGGKGRSEVSGNWLFQHSGPRTIESTREVFSRNRPEVYLWPQDEPSTSALQEDKIHLRCFTLATYDADVWSPLPWTTRILDGESGTVQVAESRPGEHSIDVEIFHQAKAGLMSHAVTLPRLREVAADYLLQSGPASYRLPTLEDGKTSYRYRSRSAPLAWSEINGELRAGASPDPAYLSLPEDPELRIGLQSLLPRNEELSLREKLESLTQNLIENHRYTLNPQRQAELSSVVDFLVGHREGYCDHFSSATALAVRLLGLPSRIAYGWSGGQYFPSTNVWVFRSREAHAWTEIFLQDYGWVTFDTTPSSREEGMPSLAEQNELPPSSPGLEFDDEEIATSVDSLDPARKIVLVSSGILLLVLLLGAWSRKSTLDARDSSTPSTIHLKTRPGYLERFYQTCTKIGLSVPAGTTLQQRIRQIQDTHMDHPMLADLLSYHYETTYENQQRHRGTERRLISAIKEWENKISFLKGNNS